MLKIAIAQMPVISAHPKKNFIQIKQFVETAIHKKQNLIVFPEMCLPGYFNGDIWEQVSFLKECEYYHSKITELSKEIHIIFGSVGCDWLQKNEDGRVRKYNAAFCAVNGNLLNNSKTNFCYWPKTLLPNYHEFNDSRYFHDLRKLAFEKGCSLSDLYEPVTFLHQNKKISVGISICEDGWNEAYSFSPLEIFSKTNYHDFFLNLSASPFRMGKNKEREIIFSALAQKINMPIFYVNCTGVQNIGKTIYGFDGCSTVYHPNGSSRELASAFESSLECVEFLFSGASEMVPAVKPRDDMVIKPRDDNGIKPRDDNGIKPRDDNGIKPRDDMVIKPRDNEFNDQITALEYILKTTCEQWNIKKTVIGVSGGIDSALSAVIMKRVLGKENVFLVNMPSQFNSLLTKNAAWSLAKNLDCAYATVNIEKSVQHSQKQLMQIHFKNSSHLPIQITSAVLENIQARDRGARILAAIAAAIGGAFTCNANKTELTVGYGTLYGDIAGFICPLADLWKYDVYNLARFYNEFIFKSEVIPMATLQVVPSAELSAEQNVLEGKGDPLIYPYHDYLFRSWVENKDRQTPEDNLKDYLENKIDKNIGCKENLVKQLFPTKQLFCADLERWWSLYQGLGAVKRMQAPPIVALSGRAFGFDHRERLGAPLFTEKYFELKMQ